MSRATSRRGRRRGGGGAAARDGQTGCGPEGGGAVGSAGFGTGDGAGPGGGSGSVGDGDGDGGDGAGGGGFVMRLRYPGDPPGTRRIDHTEPGADGDIVWLVRDR